MTATLRPRVAASEETSRPDLEPITTMSNAFILHLLLPALQLHDFGHCALPTRLRSSYGTKQPTKVISITEVLVAAGT